MNEKRIINLHMVKFQGKIMYELNADCKKECITFFSSLFYWYTSKFLKTGYQKIYQTASFSTPLLRIYKQFDSEKKQTLGSKPKVKIN